MKPSLVVLASLVSLHTHRAPSLSPGAKSQSALPVESAPVRNERAVWDASRKRDARSELLADDPYSVEANGSVLDERQQLADLSTLAISDVRMADARVLRLRPDVGVSRYRVRITGVHQRVVRTSPWNEVTPVWARHDGRWRCVAYHATRATSQSG